MTKYHEAVGRRKTASARVRIYPSEKGGFEVNGKKLEEFFARASDVEKAKAPLELAGLGYKVTVVARGGGTTGQSEAIRHGLARVLVDLDPELRPEMAAHDYLTRDSRMKERKKPGRKKARKKGQWSKR